MVSIKKMHTSCNRTLLKNIKYKYIVIHYTGNKTDTAKANANYFKSTYRGSSAHYFVDDNDIYEVVAPQEGYSWAVGVNYGKNNLFSTCKNSNSISIELCSKGGKITENTIKNTIDLTKKLMKQYNIPINNVVRHWDVCSKVCPGWNGWGTGYNKSATIWNNFRENLKDTTATKKTTTTTKTTTKACEIKYKITTSALNIRKSYSTGSSIVGTVKKNDVYTITQTKTVDSSVWGKLKSGAGWICIKSGSKVYATLCK